MTDTRWKIFLPQIKARVSLFLADTIQFRSLAYVILFHLSFSLTYIIVFGHVFGDGRRMMLLHFLLILGLIFLMALFLARLVSLKWFRTWRLARLIFSLILAICFTLLVVLYVADIVSNYWWFDNVSYVIAIHQFLYIGSYLRSIHVSPTLVYLTTGLGFVVIFSIYFKISRAMLNSFEALALRWRHYGPFRNRKRAFTTALILIVLLLSYGGSVSIMIRSVHSVGSVQREPLLGFFAPTFFTYTQARDSQVLEDKRIRKQYAAPLNFKKKNVILIIADSLRADHTHVYGYERETTPFLSELLKSGRLRKVRLAESNCSFTTCGILSTLTSKRIEKLRFNPENLRIYDLLYDQGYKVYLILSGDHTSWKNLKDSYGESIDFYFDGVSSKRFGINDDRLLLEGLENVPDYHGTPAFFYFHLMSTHGLGAKIHDYDKYQPVTNEIEVRVFQKSDPVVLINSYDNQVVQADAIIHQLFDALEQKGYLADSLVIILADHGEGLGGHDQTGHGNSLYQDQIGIPLLIYDNSDEVYKNLDFATQVDVAPTILDRLGLPIPPNWEGHSLLTPNDNEYSYHQTYVKPFLRAVIYRNQGAIYKYIYSEAERKEELYELSADPDEKRDLMATADPALISKVREKMGEHVVVVH